MILGLDLSSKSTGYAVFDKNDLIDYGCITSASTDTIKRIYIMQNEISNLLKKYPNITKVIAEEVRPDDLGLSTNLRTHKVLMYLQAALEFMIHDKHPKVTIEYLYPSEWRKYCQIKTGRGVVRETVKQRDIRFVEETFGIKVNDDIADAIGLGYAYLHPDKQKEEEVMF